MAEDRLSRPFLLQVPRTLPQWRVRTVPAVGAHQLCMRQVKLQVCVGGLLQVLCEVCCRVLCEVWAGCGLGMLSCIALLAVAACPTC